MVSEAGGGDGSVSMRVAGAEEVVAWAEELSRDRVAADVTVPEPDSVAAARAAVERFMERDADAGLYRRSAVSARQRAARASTDRLQGVSEVVQNAEDLAATEVRLQVAADALWLAHNGRPVRMRDVVPLSMPWLSSKADDPDAVGQFGIGLMSLFRFSPKIDLYSGFYRLRISEEGLGHAPQRPVPGPFADAQWTVFRVPLAREVLTAGALEEWLTSWGDEALLFLRHVSAVVLLDSEGRSLRKLTLHRAGAEGFTAEVAGERVAVGVEAVVAPGGRQWRVFRTAVTPPPGLEPEGKAAGGSTPVAVACPWAPDAAPVADGETSHLGHVHARLPVLPFSLPARVHAAFDPIPSRQDLLGTRWNLALVDRIADLWAAVVLKRFDAAPAAAWQLLPLPGHSAGREPDGVIEALTAAVVDRSRRQVGVRLRIDVPGHGAQPVGALAVEKPELTGLLTEAEIERLAGAPVLPAGVRDQAGVYRAVLEDWSVHGEVLPVEVSLWDARTLLADAGRPLEATIRLAAAGLAAGWDGVLSVLNDFAWVADATGARHRPPRSHEPLLFADRPATLAEALGFARTLHPEFLTGSPAAVRVRAWLTGQGALLNGDDEFTALRRLARLGQARRTESPLRLTDEQMCLLKDAFARLEDVDQKKLGEDIGRAVALPAYAFSPDGHRQERWAAVATAYLPAGLDRADQAESFSFAAAGTPEIVWLRRRCLDVLRRSASGLGPVEFLRRLGAASAPRTVPHRSRETRLHRLGVPVRLPAFKNSQGRTAMMRARGAQYTLGDREAPDLVAVARQIAAESDGQLRRKRAAALIHVLGRAWESRYAAHAEVMAAEARRKWYDKGKVSGFWVWQLREIEWLDNEAGVPQAPSRLRKKTTATALVYGTEADRVLHSEVQAAVERREQVLAALGVGGEPTAADIVERLRRLRQEEKRGAVVGAVPAAVLYQVLAARPVPVRAPDGDLSRADLVRAFDEGEGLVRTEGGWRTPASCLRGKPVFGRFREFAPAVVGGDVLWKMVGVPEPSADDAIAVIRQLARMRPSGPDAGLDAERQAVLLESLQLLQRWAADDPAALKGRSLRRLPLWTDRGWARQRPVYAAADETTAARLGAALSKAGHAGAVWRPGTDLERVAGLAGRLGVTVVDDGSMVPLVDCPPCPDARATARFAAAVAHLREDFQRRDPATARALDGTWEDLAGLVVCVEPRLLLRISLPDAPSIDVPARAAIAPAEGILFVTEPAELARFASVGQAVASRFRGRRSSAAYAWPVAWERAEAGHAAVDLTRSDDRIAALEAAVASATQQRLDAFRQAALARHASAPEPAHDTTAPRLSARPGAGGGTPAARSERSLIDPGQWRPNLTDPPAPTPSRSPSGKARSTGRPVLAVPREHPAVPRPRRSAPEFTQDDQEKAAIALVRAALARDTAELRDLRAQRGLGADALDPENRFYEIKSTLGAEQDSVLVSLHEYERALTEKDFFLVIVSGLDHGASVPPAVRIILDPLRHLTVRDTPQVLLTGIRSCPSITFSFETDA
ncbi:sacsin N-terminal ATP-binding-like domain-containing protein [Streptomyces litmocidini]|uniref:sacsin N-terminal ATP-binding-like domain-containing protein n=1 Tax=Streptomyces litmocidini TaxID=67318 RepID=UPI0036FCFE79